MIQILIVLLLVLTPSIGWGMECADVNKSKNGKWVKIEKCVDKDAICYLTDAYAGNNISCIKNQEEDND